MSKQFTKLKALGNGLCVYLNKECLEHLKVYKDSDICMTFNDDGTITISKAAYSDSLIETIVQKVLTDLK